MEVEGWWLESLSGPQPKGFYSQTWVHLKFGPKLGPTKQRSQTQQLISNRTGQKGQNPGAAMVQSPEPDWNADELSTNTDAVSIRMHKEPNLKENCFRTILAWMCDLHFNDPIKKGSFIHQDYSLPSSQAVNKLARRNPHRHCRRSHPRALIISPLHITSKCHFRNTSAAF